MTMHRNRAAKATFIDEQEIRNALERGKRYSPAGTKDLVAKAMELKGLELEELAALLCVQDDEVVESIYSAARQVKERIYGKRLVFFAPLYVSDFCVNNCKYCAYRRDNIHPRRKLTSDEIRREVETMEAMGHKRIALEAGEDPVNCPIDYITDAMAAIYDTKWGQGSIRRINVNIAATTVDEYRRLKDAGIGTYVLFQETYHRHTYRSVHDGPKADYDWHTTAMDRAFQGGIDDVGIGVLYGLYDWRFETLGMLMHARYLDKTYGTGPHTISFPRLRPAYGVSLNEFPHLVSDEDFKRIVAAMRLAVPYTGMILSTREAPSFREEVISLGISQISAGSCTGVGEYSPRLSDGSCPTGASASSNDQPAESDTPQFQVSDDRTLDDIISSLLPQGYVPSFCTACYRQGRTGSDFMALAKDSQIRTFCQPNAILTFAEYLEDYASESTREQGYAVIAGAMNEVEPEALRLECQKRLTRIKSGERDLYF